MMVSSYTTPVILNRRIPINCIGREHKDNVCVSIENLRVTRKLNIQFGSRHIKNIEKQYTG